MRTIYLHSYRSANRILKADQIHPMVILLLLLLLAYQLLPLWIYNLDPTAALPDAGMWSLVLLSILVFLLALLLSAHLFKTTLKWLGLPTFVSMVSQFNILTLWQQYVFYWASFALLLLAAIGCLIAIC